MKPIIIKQKFIARVQGLHLFLWFLYSNYPLDNPERNTMNHALQTCLNWRISEERAGVSAPQDCSLLWTKLVKDLVMSKSERLAQVQMHPAQPQGMQTGAATVVGWWEADTTQFLKSHPPVGVSVSSLLIFITVFLTNM